MNPLRGSLTRFVGLAVLFLLAPALGYSQEFPMLGTNAEVATMKTAFSLQWALFGGLSGNTGSALYYLSLAAALVGALLMVFNKKNHNFTTAACWFILVIIMLFAPYNSRLLFYPIDGSTTTNGTNECMQNTSAIQGTTGVCGFTPQLIAVHFGSVLQVLFYDLFNSQGLQDIVACANARSALANNSANRNSPGAQMAISNFHATCPALRDAGQGPKPLYMTEGNSAYALNAGLFSMKEVWEEIDAAYTLGDNTIPAPSVALVTTPAQLGVEAGSNQWNDYKAGVKELLSIYGNQYKGQGVGDDDDPATNTVSVEKAVGDIMKNIADNYTTAGPSSLGFFMTDGSRGTLSNDDHTVVARSAISCDSTSVYNNGNATVGNGCESWFKQSLKVMVPIYGASNALFGGDSGLVENRKEFQAELRQNEALAKMPVAKVDYTRRCTQATVQRTPQVVACDPTVDETCMNEPPADITNCYVKPILMKSKDCRQLADTAATQMCYANKNVAGPGYGEETSARMCDFGNQTSMTPDGNPPQYNEVCSGDLRKSASDAVVCDATAKCGGEGAEDPRAFYTALNGMAMERYAKEFKNLPQSVRERAGEFSPRTIGTYGYYAGPIVGYVTEWAVELGAFFSGAVAVAAIAIMRHLMALALTAIPVITPIFFILGLLIPGNALGLLFLAVMSILVLKLVPITWMIVDFVASVIMTGLEISHNDTAEALLLLGLAGLYVSSIGLTMFIMFKIGDPGNLSALARLDNAAKEAAEAGNRITKAAMVLVGSIAGGTALGAAGGLMSGKGALAGAKAAAGKKLGGMVPGVSDYNRGKDAPVKEDDGEIKSPTTDAAQQETEQDWMDDIAGKTKLERKDVASAVGQAEQAGHTSTKFGLNGEFDLVKNDDGTWSLVDADTAESASSPETSSELSSVPGTAGFVSGQPGPQQPGQGPATPGQEGGPDGSASAVTPPDQPGGSGPGGAAAMPDMAQGPLPEATRQARDTGVVAVDVRGGELKSVEKIGEVGKASPNAQQTQAMQERLGTLTTEQQADLATLSQKYREGGLTDLDQREFMEKHGKNTDVMLAANDILKEGNSDIANAYFKEAGLAHSTADKEVDHDFRSKLVKELPDEIADNVRRQHRAQEIIDRVQKGDLKSLGADGWDYQAAWKRGLTGGLSGFYGSLAGKGGALGSIPVLGEIIRESTNEWTQAHERARGWAARSGDTSVMGLARGFGRAWTDKRAAARGAHWQQEVGLMSSADSFRALQDAGAMQAQVTTVHQAARAAANQTAMMHRALYTSQQENVIQDYIKTHRKTEVDHLPENTAAEKQAKANAMRKLENNAIRQALNLNVNQAPMTVKQLEGVGAINAAMSVNQLKVEGAMFQGGQMNTGAGMVNIGHGTLGSLTNSSALKSYGSNLDQLLATHYKVSEKHMRASYGTFGAAGSNADIRKFVLEDIAADYRPGALIDIVMKKAQFMELRGQYEALKSLRTDNTQQKKELATKLAAEFAGKSKQEQIEIANTLQAEGKLKSSSKIKFDRSNEADYLKKVSAVYADEMAKRPEHRMTLALEGIHQVYETRGFKTIMSRSRVAQEELKSLNSEMLERDLRMIEKATNTISNLSPKFQQSRSLRSNKDGINIKLGSWTSELGSALVEKFGPNGYQDVHREIVSLMEKQGKKVNDALVAELNSDKDKPYISYGFSDDFLKEMDRASSKQVRQFAASIRNNMGAFARAGGMGAPGVTSSDVGVTQYAIDDVDVS